MLQKTGKFFKKFFSYFGKTELRVIKSSGIIFFKDYMLKTNLIKNICNTITDNRNPLLIHFLPYELIAIMILRILDGELRFYHQKNPINDELYKSFIGVDRVPHFITLRYYLNRNPHTSFELEEILSRQVYEEIEKRKLKELTIDIDQTGRVVYGHQQGVKKGYVSGQKNKKCYQLQTVYIRELSMLFNIEINPGNEHCAKDFHLRLQTIIQPLLERKIKLFIICDSGYGSEEIFNYLDKNNVDYIFARKQAEDVKTRGKNAKSKQEYRDPSTAETELIIKERKWNSAREIFIQNKILCDELGQYWLKEFESNEFTNVLITNISAEKEKVYLLYKKRANVENVIKELKNDFGFGIAHNKTLNYNRSLATLVAIAFNLKNSFTEYLISKNAISFKAFPTLSTLRNSIIHIPGILVNSKGKNTIRLTEKFMNKLYNIFLIFNYKLN